MASNVWSVTSYKELWRDAQACERWNMLHPAESLARSYLEQTIAGLEGPFIAASDNVRGVPQLIDPWIPGGLYILGTDGYGRSEDRAPAAAVLRGRCRKHRDRDPLSPGPTWPVRPRRRCQGDRGIGRRSGKAQSRPLVG